jgi:hypothetical protein
MTTSLHLSALNFLEVPSAFIEYLSCLDTRKWKIKILKDIRISMMYNPAGSSH